MTSTVSGDADVVSRLTSENDVVEVAPVGFGAADITALVGARVAHEILGVALASLQRDERAAAGR